MLEENNLAVEPGSAHAGASTPAGHERAENGRPKLDRKQRLVRAAGNQAEVRPVRIGRVPPPAGHIGQPLSKTPAIRPASEIEPASPSPAAEPAAISDILASLESSRAASTEATRAVADLHAKFDAMKESFDTLEAHVSIGMAKSIAEMIRGEVSAVEQQIAARYRYRTRYWLALSGVLALAGMIVVDHFHPFFDKVAALAGY